MEAREIAQITVWKREKTGKSEAKRLRRSGRAPAVAYSQGKEPLKFAFSPKELIKVLKQKGKNTLLRLKFEDGNGEGEYIVMLREFQKEPITRQVLHGDFMLIDLDRPIRVRVPIKYVGRPIGLQKGGLAEVARREVEIECLPTNIPSEIKVEVSHLDINDVLHIADIKLPEGMRVTEDPHYTLVTILAPEEEEKAEGEGEEEGGE